MAITFGYLSGVTRVKIEQLCELSLEDVTGWAQSAGFPVLNQFHWLTYNEVGPNNSGSS